MNVDTLGWTEQRVEDLTRLWREGHSASRIAIELGGGITRNAVIGKINRMKIDRHRSKPAQPGRPRLPAAPAKPKAGAPRKAGNAVGGLSFKIARARKDNLSLAEAMESVLGRKDDPFASEIPSDGVDVTALVGIAFADTTERTCKWPVGTATGARLRCCGEPKIEGSGPYCERHTRRAAGG